MMLERLLHEVALNPRQRIIERHEGGSIECARYPAESHPQIRIDKSQVYKDPHQKSASNPGIWRGAQCESQSFPRVTQQQGFPRARQRFESLASEKFSQLGRMKGHGVGVQRS